MNKVDQLLKKFETVVTEPWVTTLSGPERIWFLIYNPEEQRKIDFRLSEFAVATKNAGKRWNTFSMKNCFAEWIAHHEYRDAYFEDPDSLRDQLDGPFRDYAADYMIAQLHELKPDGETVIGVTGVASLFGFARVSEILKSVSEHVPGRMLIFFPGEHSNTQFRLLDARDGWDYLGRPITA